MLGIIMVLTGYMPPRAESSKKPPISPGESSPTVAFPGAAITRRNREFESPARAGDSEARSLGPQRLGGAAPLRVVLDLRVQCVPGKTRGPRLTQVGLAGGGGF
jgi:hypothetical protein